MRLGFICVWEMAGVLMTHTIGPFDLSKEREDLEAICTVRFYVVVF
jgi:hypothetical protein